MVEIQKIGVTRKVIGRIKMVSKVWHYHIFLLSSRLSSPVTIAMCQKLQYDFRFILNFSTTTTKHGCKNVQVRKTSIHYILQNTRHTTEMYQEMHSVYSVLLYTVLPFPPEDCLPLYKSMKKSDFVEFIQTCQRAYQLPRNYLKRTTKICRYLFLYLRMYFMSVEIWLIFLYIPSCLSISLSIKPVGPERCTGSPRIDGG